MSSQQNPKYASPACEHAFTEKGYVDLRALFDDAVAAAPGEPHATALELARKFNGELKVQAHIAAKIDDGDDAAEEIAAWMLRHGLYLEIPTIALSEVKALGERIGEAEADRASERMFLHAQLNQLQATVENYYTEAEKHRIEIEKLEYESAKLQAHRDAIKEERDILISELDRIFKSKSWRVTEPLRSVRRTFDPNQRSKS